MSSAVRPSKTESRLDYEVTQASHGFSVGTILTHTGSAYAAAKADSASNCEVIGIVSEVADSNSFTVQTSGHLKGLSGLTAGTVYFLSDTVAGAATSTEPTISKPVYYASSTTEATMLNFRGADSSLTGGGGSGDMVLISTATVSTAVSSVDFTSGIDGTYTTYLVIGSNISHDAADGVGRDLWLRTSSNGGSTYDSGASDYKYSFSFIYSNGSTEAYGISSANNAIKLSTNINGGSDEACQFRLHLHNPSDSSKRTYVEGQLIGHNSANETTFINFGGARESIGAVNAIRFVLDTGNFDSGTFKLYGIK